MEALLMEVAKPTVKILVSRAAEEIRFLRGFEHELKKLEGKIKLIASTMDMLTEVKDGAVEQWLRKALGIIYDAADLLDVLAYEKHRAVVRRRRAKKALTMRKIRVVIFAPLRRAYVRSRMGSRIRSITADFNDVLDKAKTITPLKDLVQFATASASLFLLAAKNPNNDERLQQVRRNVDMSVFVGRDSDVRSVVEMVCNPHPPLDSHNPHPPLDSHNLTPKRRISVVAIVGLGGMGKTSLAKQVYGNKTVITHFHERVWISDLKEFNIERILNEMVETLGRDNRENFKAETAVRKLEEHLRGKRYLLVLDDVWNKNPQHWNSMRSRLESIGGSMESKVLVTTRDKNVVQAMCASSIHELEGLSEDHSWPLFKQIAFEGCPEGDALALRESGWEIMKKCKGVPLAISSIAGLCKKRKNIGGASNTVEWENIKKSQLWNIPDDETGILPSLKLSYNYLSPVLKQCFYSCAFMPKNFRFDRYDLVDRWIALGLIQKSNNEEHLTLEDIGERYLNEFLSISFLFVKRRNEVGEAIQFDWHDLVYDLARSVAKHERLYLEVDKEVNSVPVIRHLSVFGHAEIASDFPDKSVLEKLHSLDNMSKLPLPRGILMHVKYLRVLDLQRSEVEELPEVIGGLKCLKLLNLAETPIKVLPECIMELYNLQSLILYQCYRLEFPGGQLSNLVNLRHLGLSCDFCPAEGLIRQMSQLHTLPPLQLSEGGLQFSELGCLHHIRGMLEIKGLELIKSKLDAEKANLSKKPTVEQLRLRWDKNDNCTNYEEVLDGLCPHPNLKLLSIKGYAGDKFPSWLTRMNICQERNNEYTVTLCNLMKIELIECGKCQQLPTLGYLSSLKMIKIRKMGNVKQIGTELYCGADLDFLQSSEIQASSSCSREKSGLGVYFASLKEFSLQGLDNLEEWCEPDGGGFPLLEELVIKDCPKLKTMPHHFPSLQELTIGNMSSSHPLVCIMTSKRSLSCLKKLHIEKVVELTHIPEELGECTSLQTLCVWDCQKLRSLPENLSELHSLEELSIIGCPSLECLPSRSGLISLRYLILIRNNGLSGVLEGLQSCNSLEDLWIHDCEQVETLSDLAGLNLLQILCVTGMKKMIMQPPDWLYNLPCLRTLHIGNYWEQNEFPDLSPGLKITSVEEVYLHGWESLQSLPEQLQHFTKLRLLAIFDFDNLEHLPDWLGHLSSIQLLTLNSCIKLKKLPSKDAMDRLTNLLSLKINNCPLLEEAVNINGSEHHKIDASRINVKIFTSSR